MAGRPKEDTVDVHKLIINLVQNGMNNTEIARVTGFSRQTIQNYLSDSTSLLGETVQEIRNTNKLLDDKEKAKLNKSALLATKKLLKKHKTTETRTHTDADGNLVSIETITRECDPNASMVQFVLKNTDPKNWSDEQNQQTEETESDNELRIVINDDTEQ